MTGLFFLARNSNNQASAIPQGILMIVLIVLTVLFHILLFTSFGANIKNLPLDLGLKIEEDKTVYTAAERNDAMAALSKGLNPLTSGVKSGANLLKQGNAKLKEGGDRFKQNIAEVVEKPERLLSRNKGRRNCRL
jgi:hypothetical protein